MARPITILTILLCASAGFFFSSTTLAHDTNTTHDNPATTSTTTVTCPICPTPAPEMEATTLGLLATTYVGLLVFLAINAICTAIFVNFSMRDLIRQLQTLPGNSPYHTRCMYARRHMASFQLAVFLGLTGWESTLNALACVVFGKFGVNEYGGAVLTSFFSAILKLVPIFFVACCEPNVAALLSWPTMISIWFAPSAWVGYVIHLAQRRWWPAKTMEAYPSRTEVTAYLNANASTGLPKDSANPPPIDREENMMIRQVMLLAKTRVKHLVRPLAEAMTDLTNAPRINGSCFGTVAVDVLTAAGAWEGVVQTMKKDGVRTDIGVLSLLELMNYAAMRPLPPISALIGDCSALSQGKSTNEATTSKVTTSKVTTSKATANKATKPNPKRKAQPSTKAPKLTKMTVVAAATIVIAFFAGRASGEPGQLLWHQTEMDLQQMQRALDQYAELKFVVNPSIVMEQEHKPSYEGISSGLLWPAFHDLIIGEYKIGDDGRTKNNQLAEDWITYVKVNYYFAVHSARKSRPQDFLWIHDYHLFLVGSITRSMMPDVRREYFLHKFCDMYNEQGMAILRGLLGFSQVGFQTQRDVDNFLKHVQKYPPEATIAEGREMADNRKSYTITYHGAIVDVGAFAISIASKQLLSWCQEEQSKRGVDELRRRLLDGKPDGSRRFVSVERIDYTKGILERLRAFQTYLRQTNRKDVYYQIAASSRTGVSSYMEYQDRVKLADEINSEFGHMIHMDMENHPQKEVVRYYMAADAIMVTPTADAMNLVVKEAIICNPKAVSILSTGAGAENQFDVADLTESYLRAADIHDTQAFADVIEKAATMDPSEVEKMGKSLFEFVKKHDIQRWLDSFLDPSWCHDVVMVQKLSSIREFQDVMMQARDTRRRIVQRVLKHQPFDDAAVLSLENIEKSLKQKAEEDKHEEGVTINLNGVELDVRDEMDLLKKDCRFIDFYQSDGDIDHFIDFLASSHPRSKDEFMTEMNAVLNMFNYELSDGIDIFITDWDGTMKTYACNYRTSIQPAYSAIVMSQFANRYTKLALVLTAGPLRDFGILDCTTMYEEGYLTVGGSWGREWLIDGKRVADETVHTIEGAAAFYQLSEAIRGLLATDSEFSKFTVVGSGFQRKVDRITVGVQNITGTVDECLSKRYVDAVLKQLECVDPERRIFEVVHLDLDLEMVLKTQDDAQKRRHWTKSYGIRFMLKEFGVGLAKGNVLICGDTISDVPMIETARQLNPDGTYAIFVNPNQDVKNKLASLLDEKHHVNVGCPEVIHAAMAKVLRPLFVTNEV